MSQKYQIEQNNIEQKYILVNAETNERVDNKIYTLDGVTTANLNYALALNQTGKKYKQFTN